MDEQFNQQVPPFKIHHRTGSVQFSLKPAHFDGKTYESQGSKTRILERGYLMVEMANAKGKTDDRGNALYDWSGKVSMKLSDVDIQQLLSGLRGAECSIVHDPNKARGNDGSGTLPNSRLALIQGERFGYFMTMSRGDNRVKCPVSDTEAATLRLLLSRALVRIFGW